MSTKALALLIAAMVCVTLLVAARIVASDDPEPARSPVDAFPCPSRLPDC